MHLKLLATFTILALAGCGTTRLPIAYTPNSAQFGRGAPVVAEIAATDARGETAADANWVGTIRGGFGNPLKRLEADRPVSEVVADAARSALRVRGLLGDAAAPYRVQVKVDQLEADQVARREAKVRLHFSWLGRADGRPLFENEGQADVVTGSIVTFEAGVFGSVEELQATVGTGAEQSDRSGPR